MTEKPTFRRANKRIDQLRTKPAIADTMREFAAERESVNPATSETSPAVCPTYTVQVSREGPWWMVAIPALGALTQASRPEDITAMARELIALETGTALADITVAVEPTTDD